MPLPLQFVHPPVEMHHHHVLYLQHPTITSSVQRIRQPELAEQPAAEWVVFSVSVYPVDHRATVNVKAHAEC